MAAAVTYFAFGGEIVYENRGGVERDYVRDPLGSTVALLNNSQTQTDTFEYWPYGEVRTRTGTTPTPFQFVGTQGYYLDSLTGFLYVRARYVYESIARWLTRDALWPTQPAYIYGANSPVLVTDPSGNVVALAAALPLLGTAGAAGPPGWVIDAVIITALVVITLVVVKQESDTLSPCSQAVLTSLRECMPGPGGTSDCILRCAFSCPTYALAVSEACNRFCIGLAALMCRLKAKPTTGV